MGRTTTNGLYVWDLETDKFNHAQLAANWDLIDSLLGSAASSVETLSALPTTGNFAGRVVMLSIADGGFPAWSMCRYDGSAWRPVSAIEIQPTVPTTGNFAGRMIVLSASDSGFNAWDVIRYDGSAWALVGGWSTVSTGGGALNIAGLETDGDIYISTSSRGLILIDRATSTKYRLYFNSGDLKSEAVT